MNVDSIFNPVANVSRRLTELAGSAPSLGDYVFFRLVLKAVDKRINDIREDILGNVATVAGSAALALMTLWLIIQGYRIVTGQARDSMAALVTSTARAALIVTLSTSMALFGTDMNALLSKALPSVITEVVTGKPGLPETQVDEALKYMHVAFAAIDAIHVIDDPSLRSEVAKAQLLVGLGTGGPAVVAGSMMVLYKIALALFIGLGPFFILCLVFDQTKSLFQKWLLYGLGTMFSMAVMAVMVAMALELIVDVAQAFWVGRLVAGGASVTSLAMQQGGLGLIMTTIIITAPPMAAMFFQGTLGNFAAYSQIAGPSAGRQSGGQGPVAGAGDPARTQVNRDLDGPVRQTIERATVAVAGAVPQQEAGRRGAASGLG